MAPRQDRIDGRIVAVAKQADQGCGEDRIAIVIAQVREHGVDPRPVPFPAPPRSGRPGVGRGPGNPPRARTSPIDPPRPRPGRHGRGCRRWATHKRSSRPGWAEAWSDRSVPCAAKRVIGMWQAMHRPHLAVLVMVRVILRVLHPRLVTRQAGSVRVPGMAEAAARGVAMDAGEFSRSCAGTHQPEGVGVVLAEVPSVGMEVRIFQRGQVVVIEKGLSRPESPGQGGHLRVAGSAGLVVLLHGETVLPAEDPRGRRAAHRAPAPDRPSRAPDRNRDRVSQLMPGSLQVVR